jgi:chromosome segregation ATPase
MSECPFCAEYLNDQELSYVESLDADNTPCQCQAAKSLAKKDEEISRLRAKISEWQENFRQANFTISERDDAIRAQRATIAQLQAKSKETESQGMPSRA